MITAAIVKTAHAIQSKGGFCDTTRFEVPSYGL
jgi:hypothetical protein